jgi:hypothetical protein
MSRPASAHGAGSRFRPHERSEGAHIGIHGTHSVSERHNKGYAARLRNVMSSSSGKAGARHQAHAHFPRHSRPGPNDLVPVRHMDDMQSCQDRIELLWTTLRIGSSGHKAASTIYHQADPLAESAVLELAMLRLQNNRNLVLGVLKCIKARENVLERLGLFSQLIDQRRFLDSTYEPDGVQERCFDEADMHKDDMRQVQE